MMSVRAGCFADRRPAGVHHRAAAGGRCADRGFTLIEVLVVVAIIALMIAILLPSLARARDQTRAAMCAHNLRHGTQAWTMWAQELQAKRIQANMGWLAGIVRGTKGQVSMVRCPSDDDPLPVPVFLIDMFPSGFGREPAARTSPDGPYSHVRAPALDGKWQVNVQDQILGTSYAGDGGGDDDIDLLFSYTAPAGGKETTVELLDVEAGWDFRLLTYQGFTLIPNAKEAKGESFACPLAWNSYGINVFGTLEGAPPTACLLTEASKTGLFPKKLGGYAADKLDKTIRFRHGGKTLDTARANVGFADGHVERLGANPLLNPDAAIWGTGIVKP